MQWKICSKRHPRKCKYVVTRIMIVFIKKHKKGEYISWGDKYISGNLLLEQEKLKKEWPQSKQSCENSFREVKDWKKKTIVQACKGW